MRLFTFLVLGLLLLGCQKEPFNDSLYQPFVGEYKNIDGDIPVYMVFSESGKVEFFKSGLPSIELQVDKVTIMFQEDLSGNSWDNYLMQGTYSGNPKAIQFWTESTQDTLRIKMGSIEVDDDWLAYGDEIRLVKQ